MTKTDVTCSTEDINALKTLLISAKAKAANAVNKFTNAIVAAVNKLNAAVSALESIKRCSLVGEGRFGMARETLPLPLTQGETCLARQDVLNLIKEMETKMEQRDAEMETMKTELRNKDDEIQTKLDKRDAEMEKLRAGMEKKVGSGGLSEAVAGAVRALPYVAVSVYKAAWSTPHATITYDSYLADYNNAGDSTLDLATAQCCYHEGKRVPSCENF